MPDDAITLPPHVRAFSEGTDAATRWRADLLLDPLTGTAPHDHTKA